MKEAIHKLLQEATPEQLAAIQEGVLEQSHRARIPGFSPKDEYRFAVYAILAHETSKHAEAIPSMLLTGRAKQLLSTVVNADKNLLYEIEKTVKNMVRIQLQRQGISDDLIQARSQLIWRDEWDYLEECSEVLGFVVEKLTRLDKHKRIEFMNLCRDWAEGKLEVVDVDSGEDKIPDDQHADQQQQTEVNADQ